MMEKTNELTRVCHCQTFYHTLLVKSPPTMWWRLIVLVLSIAVIIIIIFLQEFDDVNSLQSPIFIRCSQIFF